MKNQCKFWVGQKRLQNALKSGFGRVWAVFWALFDCPFDALNPSFFKHRSGKGFKRPFGSILDRFCRVLGGFGMDFERFGEGFGKIFYVRTPALSREAPRSVPMRGGPSPQRVERYFTNLAPVLPWEGRSPSEKASHMASRFLHRSFWEGLGPLFRICSHLFRFFFVS